MIFSKAITNYYKKELLKRFDPDGSVFYFGKNDFPGLCMDEFSFVGDKGQKLVGGFYYRGERRYDRVIVFDHGMGCGHAAYTTEVNLLTEKGFTVFTYDHTGTLNSEGEHIGGFSQSLSDLDHAMNALKAIPELKDTRFSVIGHSWGGFSTMNIATLHPEITHVVALAGFISPKAIQKQFLRGLLSPYRKDVFKLEEEILPNYCNFDARESLKKTDAKALIIHSKDDAVVSFKSHFEALRREFSESDRVEFLVLDNKGHHPHYTQDANAYEEEFSTEYKLRKKSNLLSTQEEKDTFRNSFDWAKMTEQDMDVWNKILDFLNDK